MNKEGILRIVNEQGEEKEFYILFTFNIREKNKSYVVYTDYSTNESGNIKVFSAIYHPEDENSKLEKVVEKDELELINKYLEQLTEDLKSNIKLV